MITANGSSRRDVATLAALDTTDAKRGYLAGRHWFFYEATPHECRLSDDDLIERLHEIANECTAWHDPDEVWQYVIACYIAELSGPVFPVTREEQAYWETQDQEALAWMTQQQARPDTDLLPTYPMLQEA